MLFLDKPLYPVPTFFRNVKTWQAIIPSEVQAFMPSGQAIMYFGNASHTKAIKYGKPLCHLEYLTLMLPLGQAIMSNANSSMKEQLNWQTIMLS